MNRSLKKFIYGVSYLALFGLILFGVYKSVFKTKPTCADGIRNQGEISIDCGGPCGSCETLNLEPIKSVGEVKIFGLSSGKAVIVAEIENPNENYGAIFSYNFKIYDNADNLVETIPGKGNIYETERKFIYASQVAESLSDISKVQIEISDLQWKEAKSLSKPDLAAENVLTEAGVVGIKVSGSIKNSGPFAARQLEVIAFLSDERSFEIFASKTFIADLENFAEKPFVITFPPDKNLTQRFDPKATRVFVSASF